MAFLYKKDLKCSHCGIVVPKTHGAYSLPSWCTKVITGEKPIFCSKGCGVTYRHANLSAEAKEAYYLKIATTRRNRSPKAKAKSAAKIKATRNSFSEAKKKAIADKTKNTVVSNGGYAKIVAKREQTLITRLGKDYGKVRHETYKKTMLAKEGVTNAWSNGASGRARAEVTMLELYGTTNPTKNLGIKKKLVDTYIRNNGGMGLASPSAKEAYNKTMVTKHGAQWPGLVPKIQARAAASYVKTGQFKAIETKRKNGTLPKDTIWKTQATKRVNGTFNTSKPEQYILVKLRSLYGQQVIHLYKDHLNYPWEADYYDPLTGTIFELQGYFTHGGSIYNPTNKEHSSKVRQLKATKDKWASKLTLKIWTEDDPLKRKAAKKHSIPFVEWFNVKEFDAWFDLTLAKMLNARYKKGCFRIGDRYLVSYNSPLLKKFTTQDYIVYYPWDDLQKIIRMFQPKSLVYARKTEVRVISKELANKFCDKYHLQNSCRGTTLAVGLTVDKTLIAVMTFGKPRYNKNYDYELLRLCFSCNVVGGAAKMFKFASSKLEGSIISYCDLSKFRGTIYESLGFKALRKPKPSVHWYNPLTSQRITDNLLRQRGFDKLVGKHLNRIHGKGTNNEELMKANLFTPIRDQGQAIFIKDKSCVS